MNKYNGNKEFKIDIPKSVKLIIDILEKNGYEAFAVGGCVRDTILDRKPQDWDITTSALPNQVKELFYRTIDTGIQHGTVTVLIKGVGYEVTTYRIDGEYNDSRHPESVEFTADLIEDLKRRDFTINAMAYNPGIGLVDAFDGIGDIEKKEIHLELLSDPVCISGLSIGFESVDAYPSNAPFHSSNYNEVKPVLFDEHTIIIPMFFWVASTTDAIQEELKRHSFMLVYDSNGNSDSNLGLCLLHNVSDDEYRIRTLYTVQYCAFDIAPAISRFESEKGNKPSRMTIEYKVNSLSDRLEDARIEKYTLDYKFQ